MGADYLPEADVYAALRAAPGPSPWFLWGSEPRIRSRHGDLHWADAGEDGDMGGKMLLQTRTGETLAILDFYCYVLPLEGPRFLVWYQERPPKDRPGEGGAIVFILYDADRLAPIHDVPRACSQMRRSGTAVYTCGGEVARFHVPTAFWAGRHPIDVPEPFRELEEVLVVASLTADVRQTGHANQMTICIFAVRPAAGEVEVFSQDWYNQGDFDFGYEWIVKVAREPVTGKIVGEGIRLATFVLDDTNRRVAQWLAPPPYGSPDA